MNEKGKKKNNFDESILTKRQFSDLLDDLVNEHGTKQNESLVNLKRDMVKKWSKLYK